MASSKEPKELVKDVDLLGSFMGARFGVAANFALTQMNPAPALAAPSRLIDFGTSLGLIAPLDRGLGSLG